LLDNQTTYIFTLGGTKAHIQVPAAPLMLPLMVLCIGGVGRPF
jgi:hypothetical protein